MYHSIRSRLLITSLCFFWGMTGSGKIQIAAANASESLLISEFSGPKGSMYDPLRNALIPLLQYAAFRGLATFLAGDNHNFMGKSYSEMTASAAGLVWGDIYANASATIMDEGIKAFTLAVKPYLGGNSWLIELIPDGQFWATPVVFLVSYKAHSRDYLVYGMGKLEQIALYTGNAAFGLAYGQFEKAVNQGFKALTGQNSQIFGAAATSVITAVAIGLVATRAGIDIPWFRLNEFTAFSTALAVGHTVAYTGKTFRLGIKSMLVNQSVPDNIADKLSGVTTAGIFASNVILLTFLSGRLPEGMKNYHGKVIGDMTKNIGLIFSVDLMRPGFQLVREYAHSGLDRIENILTPYILRSLTYAARDPAMILALHQGLVRLLGGKGGDTLHIRWYDLIVGYSVGGFLGVFESTHKIITDRTWSEHFTVWLLAGLTTALLNACRSGRKPKVD